jgi:hypothetical protein
MRMAPFFLLVPILAGCSDGCGNTVLATQNSPDGQHSAVLFERNCGATTPFATHISVLRKGERLSGGGNTFTADANHGAASTGAWGGPWAAIAWLSPSKLVVRYADGSRTFRREDEVEGVHISYEPVRR